MAIVVSDTSPIRALCHLGLLPLLHEIYGVVIIPPAVARELKKPSPKFDALIVEFIPFFQVQIPADSQRVASLMTDLDPGEAEAIALALELSASLILMDEMDGRQIAQSLGIKSTGVVGILLEAKKRGLIPAILPLLGSLKQGLDFFMTPKLIADALRLAGET